MAHHQRPKRARIGKRTRQNFGIGDHPVTIGKAHGAGIQQKADFRHFAPRAPLRQRRHGQHIHRCGFIRSPAGKFKRFGRVNCRQGVGAGHDGCHTARGSRLSGRFERFLVALARLADFNADINNPRGKRLAAAINDKGTLWRGVNNGPNRLDQTLFDQQAAVCFMTGFGINEARIGQQHFGHTVTSDA